MTFIFGHALGVKKYNKVIQLEKKKKKIVLLSMTQPARIFQSACTILSQLCVFKPVLGADFVFVVNLVICILKSRWNKPVRANLITLTKRRKLSSACPKHYYPISENEHSAYYTSCETSKKGGNDQAKVFWNVPGYGLAAKRLIKA